MPVCWPMSYIYSMRLDQLHLSSFFFFTAPATTEIYTLSLHDALPISSPRRLVRLEPRALHARRGPLARRARGLRLDRKSTRLNSSHRCISYAVFCLKKKKITRGLLAALAHKMSQVQECRTTTIEKHPI